MKIKDSSLLRRTAENAGFDGFEQVTPDVLRKISLHAAKENLQNMIKEIESGIIQAACLGEVKYSIDGVSAALWHQQDAVKDAIKASVGLTCVFYYKNIESEKIQCMSVEWGYPKC